MMPVRMRYSGKFRIAICLTSKRMRSFLPSTCLLFNTGPP